LSYEETTPTVKAYQQETQLRTAGGLSVKDITEEVREAVAASGIRDGLCCVYSPHTTCSVDFAQCGCKWYKIGARNYRVKSSAAKCCVCPDGFREADQSELKAIQAIAGTGCTVN
jgi:hypothetical protein